MPTTLATPFGNCNAKWAHHNLTNALAHVNTQTETALALTLISSLENA